MTLSPNSFFKFQSISILSILGREQQKIASVHFIAAKMSFSVLKFH